MPRISDDELTRLKHDIPIERLATARGIILKPSGNNLLGLRPFHDDHEPSLVITPDKNLWHCLGACQQGGSVRNRGRCDISGFLERQAGQRQSRARLLVRGSVGAGGRA
jgi:DNA primase